MSKTILADIDGFTPIIDSMAIEHGLIYAAVFGRMWRFCQMKDGVCQASLETISHGLHVDRATVMRYAERLVQDGYLKDLTPDLRNVPHTYADTGKASIRVGVVAHDNAEIKSVAQRNKTVAQSKLKIVSKKEKDTCPSEWMNALYKICGIDPALASIGMRKQISDTGKALISTAAELTDLTRFAEWWVSDTWRRDNRPITPNVLRNEWAKFKSARIKSENLTI